MSEMWPTQTKPYADEVDSGSSRFLGVPASLKTNRGLSSKPLQSGMLVIPAKLTEAALVVLAVHMAKN